ncbi:hypothetical protein [Paraburkholderia acidiphila]|uniref:Uncharacterized protein n=1 Tax=Paraburkholderia acidiphila TaxID=2571747 RepID=A0A7Z2G2B5_9BURK|nr:hypothetical protein [Paraburkholderia acidiphila]QGZ53774.1 hypothetical protein FAZ97_01975 [Paraburkholderia acidiphila]
MLDMTFGEDQCEEPAQNFAILRRIALKLLKRDTVTKDRLKTDGSKPAPAIRITKRCLAFGLRAIALGSLVACNN